jgi:hypothetical protein
LAESDRIAGFLSKPTERSKAIKVTIEEQQVNFGAGTLVRIVSTAGLEYLGSFG